ncbi:glutathione S-transferase [Sphingomonas sp. BK036]|uniref:glutathione S-transferase family protein n=1 Tax=Sphingomonas sp. BK036 TaxID=2512122 RepID=UPI00102A2F3B|nr:glutathione S-transferase [Sphingomonas sp. BK036]RZT56022.1 glutathione S-transferase [Sphingomonas sp. BK036]
MLTLHHLNYSRSIRVIWLLEELGIEYDLVKYERDANFRAPPELKAIHPLGKAPVLVDGDLTLAESAPILAYIDERYGERRFSPPIDSDAAAVHDEWLQYVESSAALPIMMTSLGKRMGGLPDGLAKFTGPEVTKTLDYIGAGVGEGPYLMGEQLMLADIQMCYILAIAESAGLLGDHPDVAAYLDRLRARPAFVAATEIGGPLMAPRR